MCIRDSLDTVYATDAQFETDQHGAWRADAAVRERVRRALSPGFATPSSAPLPRRPALADRSGAATAAC